MIYKGSEYLQGINENTHCNAFKIRLNLQVNHTNEFCLAKLAIRKKQEH